MIRIRKLELRVSHDRNSPFRTTLFERDPLSEKAFVGAFTEMFVRGRLSPEGESDHRGVLWAGAPCGRVSRMARDPTARGTPGDQAMFWG